jgi:CxxC motif-containing protein (DUF1111 family)
MVELIATYLRALPPPAEAAAAGPATQGRAIFAAIGCAACHAPQQPAELAEGGIAWFSPYSDLLLHDARARSILEAILWHGGEAAPAKARAAGLSADDRAALIAFLESL